MPVTLVMLAVMLVTLVMPEVTLNLKSNSTVTGSTNINLPHRISKPNFSHETIDRDNHTPWNYQYFVIDCCSMFKN